MPSSAVEVVEDYYMLTDAGWRWKRMKMISLVLRKCRCIQGLMRSPESRAGDGGLLFISITYILSFYVVLTFSFFPFFTIPSVRKEQQKEWGFPLLNTWNWSALLSVDRISRGLKLKVFHSDTNVYHYDALSCSLLPGLRYLRLNKMCYSMRKFSYSTQKRHCLLYFQ